LGSASTFEAVEPTRSDTVGSPAFLLTLLLACQRLFGAALLLLGILTMSTLVLLPVGLPLALLAVALIVAPPAE
jgi:hypothetical protein